MQTRRVTITFDYFPLDGDSIENDERVLYIEAEAEFECWNIIGLEVKIEGEDA